MSFFTTLLDFSQSRKDKLITLVVELQLMVPPPCGVALLIVHWINKICRTQAKEKKTVFLLEKLTKLAPLLLARLTSPPGP